MDRFASGERDGAWPSLEFPGLAPDDAVELAMARIGERGAAEQASAVDIL
jgi:hypothetical protein